MASTLKLIMEKGPRSGETLEFNSRSKIRLGRVVKGNNVPIKDPGISTKHLSIDFNLNSGKWVITDLDSSNGTILNSSELDSLCPFEISDGDVIKIGEVTLIRVGIGGGIDDFRNPSDQNGGGIVEIGDGSDNRRNLSVRNAGEIERNCGVKDENGPGLGEEVRDLEGNDGGDGEELEKENGKGRGRGRGQGRGHGRGRGRGRGKQVSVMEERNGENEGNVKGKVEEYWVSTKRMRSSRREVEELVSLDVVMPVRRTRGKKNVEDVAVGKVDEGIRVDGVDDGEAENVGVVESKRTRGGRGRKKMADIKEEINDVEDINVPEPAKGALYEKPLSETVERNEQEEEANKNMLEVDVPEHGVESKGNDRNEEGKVEHGVSTRRTRSSKREVEELVSLDVGMPAKRTRSSKNVEDVVVKKAEERKKFDVSDDRQVENVGVVENKRRKGGRRRKEGVNKDLDGIKDVLRDGANIVEEKSSSDLLEVGFPAQTGKFSCDEKQSFPEPMDETTRQNESEDIMNKEVLLYINVPDHVEGYPEHSCADSVHDTLQNDKLENTANGGLMEMEMETTGGSLSLNEQPCSELVNEIDQQIKLITDKKTNNVLELEVGEHVGGSVQDERVADASHVEQGISDKLESDLVLKGQIMGECDTGEIPEETDTSYHGGETHRDSVHAPDLDKMTLGEWFDYLELYLPKQIYDATDEIIEDMRKRTKQFDGFVSEHQKEKSKLPEATEKRMTGLSRSQFRAKATGRKVDSLLMGNEWSNVFISQFISKSRSDFKDYFVSTLSRPF